MQRKIVLAAVLVMVAAVLTVRSGLTPHAQAAKKRTYIYRCLTAEGSMAYTIYNPGSHFIEYKVLSHANTGVDDTTVTSGLSPHQSAINFITGTEADFTSSAKMFVTATAGSGDAIHTIRCS